MNPPENLINRSIVAATVPPAFNHGSVVIIDPQVDVSVICFLRVSKFGNP